MNDNFTTCVISGIWLTKVLQVTLCLLYMCRCLLLQKETLQFFFSKSWYDLKIQGYDETFFYHSQSDKTLLTRVTPKNSKPTGLIIKKHMQHTGWILSYNHQVDSNREWNNTVASVLAVNLRTMFGWQLSANRRRW